MLVSMSKTARHKAILDLLDDGPVESQEALQHILERKGIEVGQATLSRHSRTEAREGSGGVPARRGEPQSGWRAAFGHATGAAVCHRDSPSSELAGC